LPTKINILFLGVFDEKSTNYGQANAFEKLGHDVSRYEYREQEKKLGQFARDGELEFLIKNGHYDLVIFSKCNHMSHKVVECASTYSTSCLWMMDPETNMDQEFLDKARAASFCVYDKKRTLDIGLKYNPRCYYVTDGYDADLHYPVEVKQDVDVSFIGSFWDSSRHEYLKMVDFHHFTGLFGEQHNLAVCRSKINLNLCSYDTASNRVYKILAAGGFLMTDDWPGRQERFINNEDLVIFNSPQDMKEKVEFYLLNPSERTRIAQNGRFSVKPYDKIGWAKQIIKRFGDQDA